ncbi:MAG: ABC transporter ATP-binding protein [Tissierellales bacterium]|nr:ABC transporter ATP-binding protein [Tissierellales bacterium]
MKKILEINGLVTSFILKDETIQAVQDVSFYVNQGETFGLVGESGCGKSATCRSVLRLIRDPGKILNGEIIYKGIDLLKLTDEEMVNYRGSEIAMIFQEPMTALNPVLTIRKQIYEALKRQKLSKNDMEIKAINLLKKVGISSPEQRLDNYPHQFSGGMRQRAMIAISLASEPALLVADEPTTALDVTIQDQIIKLINNLKIEMGMSIILVTHDLGVVAQMCDRVAVMYAGKIMESADTLTLFSTPRHPYTIGLMNSIPHTDKEHGKLIPIEGNPPNLSNPPIGCPFEPRCRYSEEICKTKEAELIEIGEGHKSRCHFIDKLIDVKGIIEK